MGQNGTIFASFHLSFIKKMLDITTKTLNLTQGNTKLSLVLVCVCVCVVVFINAAVKKSACVYVYFWLKPK